MPPHQQLQLNHLTLEKKQELLRLAYEKNRLIYNKDFYEFFKELWKVGEPSTPLEENWHIHYLCYIAQRFTMEVVNKQEVTHSTILVNVPPRSLKSWIFNIALPVWTWTLEPTTPIITASYSEVLSLGFARKAIAILKSDWFTKVYGDLISIDQSEGGREAVNEMQNSKGGIRFSTSTSGTIVGKGFLLGVIDDPLKPSEAKETKALEKNINFWNESFDTRRNQPKKSLAIVIMQRLAETDLSGYLVESLSETDKFLHINLPAVQDGTEKIPYLDDFLKKFPQYKKEVYKRGYLFGDRFDESFIRAQQKKGTIFWNTQYQQNPLPSDGLVFKRDWFGTISYEEFYKLERAYNLKRTFVTDTAYTDKTINDPTAILTYATHGNKVYIINFTSEHIESAKLPEWIETQVRKNGYDEKKSLVTIEPKGSGMVVISLLKNMTKLNVVDYKYPRSAKVNINMSKEVRAEAITSMVESGRVVLVEGGWNERFLSEVTTFPLAKNDEGVDCLVMACLRSHYVDSVYKKFGLKRKVG